MKKYDLRHKETIRLFLREYFELFFPDLAGHMRFDTAQFLDKELLGPFRGKGKDARLRADALVLIEMELSGRTELILPNILKKAYQNVADDALKTRTFELMNQLIERGWRQGVDDLFEMSRM